jgi:hypothetical protein
MLTALCVAPYLRDMYRGTTRPQRVSWFVFAVLSIVATISQFAEGATAGAWLSSGAAVGFTVVFVASIRRGQGGSTSRDHVSLLIAAVGVVASLVTHHPLAAVVAVIIAELVAVSMTARKAAIDPGSETLTTWVIDTVSGFVAITATSNQPLAALLYPAHHACANGWVVTSIVRGRARQRAQRRPTVSVLQNASGYTSAPLIDGV